MKLFNMIKQEKENDGQGGGAGGTPPATPPAQSTPPTPNEEGGDNFDDFGYAKPKAPVEPGKEGEKTPEKTVEPKVEEKIEAPATGYGVESPKVDETKAVEDKKTSPVDLPKDLGYELDIKDLPAEEIKPVLDIVKAHSLSKEAAQALVDYKKNEIKSLQIEWDKQQEAQKKGVADLKASWDRELRTDAVFGGEKFAHNVMRAEKVLAEFMPQTKKELTERKSMLPPYVMKDLAKFADHLYGAEKLVPGEAGTPSKTDNDESDDPLAFYGKQS